MIARRSLVAALILSGCFAAGQPPPDLVIIGAESELTLAPVSYCWNGFDRGMATVACADGLLPDPLPHVGQVERWIDVEWPLANWTFEAAMTDPNDLEHEMIVRLVDTGDGVWRLEPNLGSGAFRIGLSGYGPQGSVVVAFLADFKA